MAVTIGCAAKINLFLEVIRRRDDGYHDIETLFQPVSIWDELTLTPAAQGIEISGDDPSIPWNENNLCHRAAGKLFEKLGFSGGVRIDVQKEIPPGAGLGGGSSDAAATLVGLNELFGFGIPREELFELALGIGSDVPFFIFGKPAVGRGRGEVLEEVVGLPEGWILIVKPDVNVSTKWAYQNLRFGLTRCEHKIKLNQLLEGLEDFPNRELSTYNSFESGVVEHFSEIKGLLSVLRREKAILCSLSGSGSACFAVFEDRSRAEDARNRIMSNGLFARVTRPVEKALKLLRRE